MAVRTGGACLGCGKPGGHAGRASRVECPLLARRVVRRARQVAYRFDRWVAGDDGALTDSLEDVHARERKSLLELEKEDPVGEAAEAAGEAQTGGTPAQAPDVEPRPRPSEAGARKRIRWWILGRRDYLRKRLAATLEIVAGWVFDLGGGDPRESRLSYWAYEFVGWVDSWKRG